MPAEAPATTEQPLGFLDALDAGLSDDPAPSNPPAGNAPPAGGAPPNEPPALKVPDAITDKIVPKDPNVAPPAGDPAKPEEWETKADELFKTKAGEAFGNLKKELKTARQQLAEAAPKLTQLEQVTKELEEAKKGGASASEIESLRREKEELTGRLTEYEKELMVSKVEATQEYKQSVTALFQQINGTVEQLAKQYEIEPGKLHAALQEPDPAKKSALLSQVASEMSEYDRMRYYDLAKTQELAVSRDKLVKENASAALKLIEEGRAKQNEAKIAQSKQDYTRALDESGAKLSTLPLLKKVDGNADWNKRLDDMENFVRGVDWEALPPMERAMLVRQGASFTLLLDAVQYYAQQAQQAQAELAKVNKAIPGAGGGRAGAPPAGTPAGKELGFLDAMEQGLS